MTIKGCIVATISEVCEFLVDTENVILETQVNGDRITIHKIHLDREAASSLAWILQDGGTQLKIKIKVKD